MGNTVIRSAVTAWEKQLEMDRNGDHPLYRLRDWNKGERAKKKEYKKSGWIDLTDQTVKTLILYFSLETFNHLQ